MSQYNCFCFIRFWFCSFTCGSPPFPPQPHRAVNEYLADGRWSFPIILLRACSCGLNQKINIISNRSSEHFYRHARTTFIIIRCVISTILLKNIFYLFFLSPTRSNHISISTSVLISLTIYDFLIIEQKTIFFFHFSKRFSVALCRRRLAGDRCESHCESHTRFLRINKSVLCTVESKRKGKLKTRRGETHRKI